MARKTIDLDDHCFADLAEVRGRLGTSNISDTIRECIRITAHLYRNTTGDSRLGVKQVQDASGSNRIVSFVPSDEFSLVTHPPGTRPK